MTEGQWKNCTSPTPMLIFLRGHMTRQVEVHFGRRLEFERYLHRRISDRKFRLFACACCRRIERMFTINRLSQSLEYMAPMREYDQGGQFEPDCCIRALALAEQIADGVGDVSQLELLRGASHEAHYPSHVHAATVPRLEDMDWDLMATGSAALAVECAASDHFVATSAVVGHAAYAVACAKSQVTREEPDNDPDEMRIQCHLLRDIVGNPFRAVPFALEWRTSDVLLLAQGIYGERAFDRMPILADALQDAGCDGDDLLLHLRAPNATHVRGCWALDLVLGKD